MVAYVIVAPFPYVSFDKMKLRYPPTGTLWSTLKLNVYRTFISFVIMDVVVTSATLFTFPGVVVKLFMFNIPTCSY